MTRKLKTFERVIISTLIIMMVCIVTLSTFRLGWKLVEELMKPLYLMLNIEQLFVIFA